MLNGSRIEVLDEIYLEQGQILLKGFFVLFVTYALIVALRLVFGVSPAESTYSALLPWVLSLPQLALLVFVWQVRVRRKSSWKAIGFCSPNLQASYQLSLLCVPLNLILAASYAYGALRLGVDLLLTPMVPKDILGDGLMVIVNLVAIVVWVPVVEEIFFRGFLLKTMLERHSVYVAIPASSLLFALLHGHLGLLVPVLLSSIVISILYIHTRSLLPPILAHSTQNLVVSVVAVSA